VRSPVARRGAALSLVVGTTCALVLMGAQVAMAATGVVESRVSGSPSGLVGLTAVVLGAVGLIFGLIRRRKTTVIHEANQRIALPAEEAPVTTQA
jgi:hypothetical protein